MTATFEGVVTALVTPFRDGRLDEEALRLLVRRQVAAGNGIAPCGTTGESPTLSPEEHERIVQITVEEARGKVPVVAGVGTPSTRRTIELARRCRELGADGLLIVCPSYNKPTQHGLEAHFRAIADAVPLPAMLYNVPGRTAVDLTDETLARLFDVPSIVAIKEASGNVVRAQRILARDADRVAVLAGDDALTLPIMAVGGKGVVSVTANLFPHEMARLVQLIREEQWADARKLHLRLLPVHESFFIETNPIPVKAAMYTAGLITGEVRLPLTEALPETLERVKTRIRAAGLELKQKGAA